MLEKFLPFKVDTFAFVMSSLLIAGVFVLRTFGVDLTGIWVTLGGATFIIGFAVKDILANFFSGIVLLIDTPFTFGDVLRLEDGSVGMLRKIGQQRLIVEDEVNLKLEAIEQAMEGGISVSLAKFIKKLCSISKNYKCTSL